MLRTAAIVLLLALSSACQWVKLTPEGEAVRVGTAAEVASCKKLGTASGRTKAAVGPAERDEAKVALEIETLARNEAATIEGRPNVIVPIGPAGGDQRDYAAYRCD